jgi:hypothetical protein
VDAGPEESPIFAGLIPEPPSVTGRLLHDFPLRSVVGPARTEVLDLLRAAPLAEGGEIRALVECRQPRYEHGHYEAVARIYREAVANGEFPLAAINRAYPWATRGAVGQWVYRCRHTLGLLDPIS